MPNPGVFGLSQKQFLMGEKEKYAAAVAKGAAKDQIKDITRQFFLYYPVDRPFEEQPTSEALALVNVDFPSPEYPLPIHLPEESTESYEKRMRDYEEYSQTLLFRMGVSYQSSTFEIKYYSRDSHAASSTATSISV